MATVIRKPIVVLTAWTMLAQAGFAQAIHRRDGATLTPPAIDATMSKVLQENSAAGLGLAVIQNGQLVYLRAYGLRDVAHGLTLTPDTPMRAASLTKATFATMVMPLVDEGTIDLDRSIAAYLPKPLPSYRQYADLAGDPRWRKLTFRIRLYHTTGFANDRGVRG